MTGVDLHPLPPPEVEPPAMRSPYWLRGGERADLADAIGHVLTTCTVLPAVAGPLHAVLTELGVAAARDRMWPVPGSLVRQVSGHSKDALPVRMSEQEVNAVLGLTTLPATVRRALTKAGDR